MWGICFTYGTWFAIDGLISAGVSSDHPGKKKRKRKGKEEGKREREKGKEEGKEKGKEEGEEGKECGVLVLPMGHGLLLMA